MDIQVLIDKVMDNLRRKHGETDTFYTDEAILRPASKLDNYLPEAYAEMRSLAMQGPYYIPEEELFYRQGVLMAQHEDDCPYSGKFLRYRPTYHVLTDAQLRGYFTWRAKVRKGIIEKTALSFVYIYLYELLCHIGVDSAEEAYDTIVSFVEAYKPYDLSILSYVERWLTDLWVYDQPRRDAPVYAVRRQTEEKIAALCEPFSQSDEVLYEAINALTGAYLARSRFVREYEQDMRSVVCGVYRALFTHHERHCKTSLPEKLFGRAKSRPYRMFASAVFYRPERHADCEVVLSPLVRYTCQNGVWQEHRLCDVVTQSRELTNVVRTIDGAMRRAYDYKHPLKEESTTKLLGRMIEAEITRVTEEKKAAARPVIEIDVSKLAGIRTAAAKTRDSLLVEEECEPVPLVESLSPAPVQEQQDLPLSSEECGFLRCLLTGGDALAFARERRLMPSVLADSINEKLFDVFADTVLDCAGDAYGVIEDYQDELKEMLHL